MVQSKTHGEEVKKINKWAKYKNVLILVSYRFHPIFFGGVHHLTLGMIVTKICL
jgi:hypothetical protein